MKERLIIAKEFLRDDGVILVQCDDNEQAYLKVLMDEIFGRINFMSLITCKTKAPSGIASKSQPFFNCSEYIICFAKNKNKLSFNHIFEEVEIIDNLSKSRKFYNYCLNYINFSKKEFIKNFGNGKLYKIPYNDFNITKMKSFSSFEFYNMFDKIFRLGSLSGANEKKIKQFLDKNNDSKECVFVYEHNLNGKMRSDLIYKNSGVLMLKNYAKINHIDKNVKKIQHITSLFTNDWWQGISSEGGILLKNGKKPEILIKTLFDIFTNENDIIMDFFAGSGTTLAVAHKMNRHYIGIEMNDYIESITYKRLMNVIEGDQSGISKEVDWKGGGSFNFIKNLI